ncbi:MAG TPA: metal-dependent hydrolase [Usitatibacter sp.]|nr:metal-dependent hydrolase [Usitatibacter sp.]
MFLGHFGVALAAKEVAPTASLGTTILAAEFLDSVWPLFLLSGVETVEIVPGITKVTPLDFTSYPWSHSLAMAIAWGVAFAAVYWLVRRNRAAALWLGAIVVSHWFLDWVVHRPDLPLYPGEAQRHGLGLWNSVPISLALELATLAAGLALYLRATRAKDRVGSAALWALVALLVILYMGATFGPPPPSVPALAASTLLGYLFVPWGWWIDRHRVPRRLP